MDEREIVRRLALRVRRALLALQRREPDIFDRNLAGACALGSTMLFILLRAIGLRPAFVVGVYLDERHRSTHAWLELDGEIVDVTATQFGHRPFFTTESEDDRYEPIYRGGRALDAVMRWRPGQSPAAHFFTIDAAVTRVLG